MTAPDSRLLRLFVTLLLAASSGLGAACGSGGGGPGGAADGSEAPEGEDANGILAPDPSGEGGGSAAPRAHEVLVHLDGTPSAPVVSAATTLGWKVVWKSPASRLWLFRPGGALAAPVATVLQTLRVVPGVRTVEENLLFTIDDPFGRKQSQAPLFADDLTISSMRSQPALRTIHAVAVGPAGPPPVVAVIDGGFDLPHEALPAASIEAGYDAIAGDSVPDDDGNGLDDDADGRLDAGVGHGTAVAALVLTVAPSARVLAVRALDDEGDGTTATLAAAVDWAAGRGADVINISAGASGRSAILDSMLASARQRGAVIVASAGNGEGGPVCFPASSAHALAVCGVADDLAVDPTSSRGPSVDLGAPSVDVVAPFPGTVDGYAYWQGTSFAAPLTSGAIAQLLAASASATPSGEAQGILTTLTPYPPSEPATYGATIGGGVLDLQAALER